jgi:hypothetical protein
MFVGERFMNRVVLFLVLICAAVAPLAAQQTQQGAVGDQTDISGMYSFTREGEFVQITKEEQGKLTGFISRYGDLDSDRGAFLDQFFKTGTTDGTKLDFTTEEVHGIWFEFSGTVGRGSGKTPDEEGYYVIRGKLTRYSKDAARKTSAQSREIEMKSFPRDAAMEPPQKRD